MWKSENFPVWIKSPEHLFLDEYAINYYTKSFVDYHK